MGARETALNVLIACRKDGAWSNGALKEYIRRDRLDGREAALASRLCYGVIQNRALLDSYLSQLLTGKLKDLHPAVRDILHLGLYQIYKMDKIPDSAAVNESVALAKKYCRFPKASGLVNAVLRNAVRSAGTLREPQTLAVLYSHPQELVDLLKSYVGEENLENTLRANNEIPPIAIQVNTLKTTADVLIASLRDAGVTVKEHTIVPDCLILENTGNIEALPDFQKGHFYVQDPASRLSVLCADIQKGHRVLDCCSAPGGKSFAAALCGAEELISCDVHPHKVELLRSGAQRLGITHMYPRLQDATEFVPEWENAMDRVIADVPCSGYGIIRKKPDIRYKSPDFMRELPELQLKILQNQCRYVKPGGILLYSTCTLVRRENEGVVERFLKENPNFVPEPLPLPEVMGRNENGMTFLIPGKYNTDGFFICRLRRKE